MNLVEQHTKLTHQPRHQKQYLNKGVQTDIITPLWRTMPNINIPGPLTFILTTEFVITRPPRLHTQCIIIQSFRDHLAIKLYQYCQ